MDSVSRYLITLICFLSVFSMCFFYSVLAEEHLRPDKLSLPVYLNSTRSELLFTVELDVAPGQDHHTFYERGVALLTSTALN